MTLQSEGLNSGTSGKTEPPRKTEISGKTESRGKTEIFGKTELSEKADSPRKICLVAGWGRYPVYVAKSLKEQGFEVHCFGVKGHADRLALSEVCAVYRPVGMCRIGKIIRHMRRHEIKDFIMLGKYFKRNLFHPFSFFVHTPDWLAIRTFASYFISRKHDCQDDSLMNALIRLFESFGLRMGAPTDFAPELLAGEGILTKKKPTESQWRDIRYGMKLARELGRFDVGQTVLATNGVAIALEAIEGTDSCIERAGKLSPKGDLTLVKVAKPNQDMRFDVPTIGMQTLKNFAKAGGAAIAIEAGRSILIDREEVLEFADSHGIAICAVRFESD